MIIYESYTQHDPVRVVNIYSKIIKVLSDGIEIISYYWEGLNMPK